MASSPEADDQLSPPPPEDANPPPDSVSAPPPEQSPPISSPPPSPPATSPPPPAHESPPPPSDSDSHPPPTFSPPPHDSPPSQLPPVLSPPQAIPHPPPTENLPISPPTVIIPQSPPPTGSIDNPPSPSIPVITPPAADGVSPPSRWVSPPTHSNPWERSLSPGSSSGGSPGSSSSGVVIAGIVIGGILILAILVCFICSRRKKKTYYMNPVGPPRGNDQYYNGHSQWNSPHPGDQIVKIPPPSGFDGATGWGAPPPVHTSSEFGSNYSGQHQTPIAPSPLGGGMAQFTNEDLAAATAGFSQSNVLGQGGFGFVHKGILPDKREVAIKSLKTGSGQGDREFHAEVEIISRVHHRHLVSLVGYCIANGQRMLVYEFVPNKTLEFHLHGKNQPVMNWETRLRIAVGSAKGLAYLHEDCHPRIIHRDIKAANILLDFNFEAMVADFGLAKLTTDNYTHVSTRVMGTFGYLAPEYASSGKLTEKSDVFSFGVMLELITGRRPVDLTNTAMEDSLVDWARPRLIKAIENGDYSELVDPRLEDNYNPQELARMISCASSSIRHSARMRPRMSQIVRALEGDSSLQDLNEGAKTGQSAVINPSSNTDAYDTRAYNADMMKFRKMVMPSQDMNSSQYGTTSEYGLNPSISSDDSAGSFSQTIH